jgi:hypothetical protein
MQKIAIGLLAVLVLFLAGWNARLVGRERHLAARVAALEAAGRNALLNTSTPAPTEPAAVAAVVEPQPAAPQARTASPAPPQAPVGDPATTPAREFVARVQGDLVQRLANGTLTFTLSEPKEESIDEALGLTPSQKTAIGALRAQRDAAVDLLEDRILSLTEQTEQSIRGLLTPEQRAKYEAEREPVQARRDLEAIEEPLNPSGRKPGYLGINGGNAQGGGATVTQVHPNSVAHALGLQKDDVILEVNGQPVAGLIDLASKIRESGEGSPVNLRIRRGGTEFYQGLQLGGVSK